MGESPPPPSAPDLMNRSVENLMDSTAMEEGHIGSGDGYACRYQKSSMMGPLSEDGGIIGLSVVILQCTWDRQGRSF